MKRTLEEEIERLKAQKNNTRFADLARVCQERFGRERIKGSHHIWKTPWRGDPRLNLQEVKGNAKPYQIEQVIDVLEKLEVQLRLKQVVSQSAMKGDA